MAQPRTGRVMEGGTVAADRARALTPDSRMLTAQWERVHELLHEVCETEPAARRERLEQIGRQDATLRREVESLLDAIETPGRFDELVDRFVSPGPESTIPDRIGAYRPVRLIARGGMGTVWLAERADGAFEQTVALKLLPAGTRTDLHSRFLAERHILARLQHPNIARLLDGGTTTDGLPWLALEYVEGETLTAYCDNHRLPVEARLRLFLDVCAAVSRAHAKLIVHRDIKPANVLVESVAGTARVKLLDFGIAKLLEDDSAEGTADVTRADLRLLTPDYAAPEQVRGEPITTATDVYQLGALLYELLAGRRPHHIESRTLQHIQREICERVPAPPSSAFRQPRTADTRTADADMISRLRMTSPKRLARALDGDLDTIVMRAMAKEPERRYPSVEAFATDVRRHLDGLPVHARPDSLQYRAGKFMRRHLAAVLAGGAITTLLLTLVVSTALQNRRIDEERDRAEQAAGFLAELFEDLEPASARGNTVDPREILGRAAERVTSEMQDQPLLQARLFDVLGRVHQMRGFYAEAEPLLRQALSLRTDQLGEDQVDVADSRYALAGLLAETGRHTDAEPLLAGAAATFRRRLGAAHPRVASVEIDRALARRAAGDFEAADIILAGAIQVLRNHPDHAVDLATALLYHGKVRVETGRAEAAEPLLREALELRRQIFGNEHPTVANALDGIGELEQAREDHAAAEVAYREALDIRKVLFPPDHADIGVSLENIGMTLYRQGRDAEAVALLDSALAVLRPTFGAGHPLVTTAIAYRDSASSSRRQARNRY